VQLDKVTGSNMAEQMRKDLEQQKLKSHQQELLSAFYSGRREAIPDGRIPYATLQRVVEAVNYEPDHAISIIQHLDDKLIELQNEKRQKEIERMKSKGAKR
jgi:hypothetical protein